ncbi:hypothetical protein [Clostridium lacusfryxellense]|uniref:hypothetical protein n=1 Tax=Clostridium lacusfryxellense TaxID=205328 RepID=UPI001C0B7630|nr:hypothetical protein [Clostridium lacusfryxellense]MBU3113336.1 hypothetical protein [Clostridium lacusfryxellense]
MKKSKIKLITSVLLTAVMVSSFTGCNKNKTGETSSKSQTNQKIDPTGKYEPGITINVAYMVDSGKIYPAGQSLEDNVWTRLYKDKLGITLKTAWTATLDQFPAKMSVAIASNTMPDIYNASGNTIDQIIVQDLYTDLNDVYSKYASPMTKEILEKNGGIALNSSKTKGKLFALPTGGANVYQNAPLLWLRSDWLKNVGLSAPKTYAEMETVMDAFTNKDPDKNGKNDTTAMVVQKDLFQTLGIDNVFLGNHAYAGSWVKDSSGKLVWGGIQPEMKKALAKAQEYYKKNYIPKEFITMDYGASGPEYINSGKAGMAGGAYYLSTWPINMDKTIDADWVSVPLPSVDGQPVKYPYSVGKGTQVVTKDFKYPEAIIKMANLYTEKCYGKSDADYKMYNQDTVKMKDKDGKEIDKTIDFKGYALVKVNNGDNDLNIFENVQEAFKSKDTSKLTVGEKIKYDDVKKALDNPTDKKANALAYSFKPEGSLSIYENTKKNKLELQNGFYGLSTETMTAKGSSLNKMQTEMITKIILGQSVDSFDKFVKDWKKLGGDQMTKEVNEWNTSK